MVITLFCDTKNIPSSIKMRPSKGVMLIICEYSKADVHRRKTEAEKEILNIINIRRFRSLEAFIHN